MRKLSKLCVVIPGLNESDNLPVLYTQLHEKLGGRGWDLEIIFIDDGSTDTTLLICRKLHALDPLFQYISLSRNFGHQRALTAGLDIASGDATVVMDADLQDPPEVVLEMIKKWEAGVDVAYGQRQSREGETLFKKFTAKLFYKTMGFFSGTHIPEDTGDFRLMDQEVVHHLRRLREQGRFMRGLVSWVGFKQEPVLYDRKSRHSGTTNYPLFKMIRFAWEGITSFSVFPLRLATLTGACLALSAFAVALHYIFRKEIMNDQFVKGWVSLMVAILGVGGILLLFIGVVGEYLAKAFEELKERPLYIVRESTRSFDSIP